MAKRGREFLMREAQPSPDPGTDAEAEASKLVASGED